jgi:hypothetical protein
MNKIVTPEKEFLVKSCIEAFCLSVFSLVSERMTTSTLFLVTARIFKSVLLFLVETLSESTF